MKTKPKPASFPQTPQTKRRSLFAIGRLPLAWLQLTHEKVRLMVALAGIAFADILMFMQLGFRDALFESAGSMPKRLTGDIFLISPQSNALIAMDTFSERRLYQAMAFEGVTSVTPIYIGFALWKNPETKLTRSIMVVGFNPRETMLDLPGLKESLPQIQLPDVVLFDRSSREEFGSIVQMMNTGKPVTTEVEERKITVGGLFSLGASFGADGNLITSDLNFLRIFSKREKGLIDIGSISVKPGVDVDALVAAMRKEFPNDVLVLSKAEYVEFETNYWKTSTAIGFVFALGTVMGFIVGTVIVYQILYTDVADHLPEYATLKAMGYRDMYLLGVVAQEALLLAFLGYLPGVAVSVVLYQMTQKATMLPILMTQARMSTVLMLTVVMCLISGAIAMRKLRAADPADIF